MDEQVPSTQSQIFQCENIVIKPDRTTIELGWTNVFEQSFLDFWK